MPKKLSIRFCPIVAPAFCVFAIPLSISFPDSSARLSRPVTFPIRNPVPPTPALITPTPDSPAAPATSKAPIPTLAIVFNPGAFSIPLLKVLASFSRAEIAALDNGLPRRSVGLIPKLCSIAWLIPDSALPKAAICSLAV